MGVVWSLPISPSMLFLDWPPFGYSGLSQLGWTLGARRSAHKGFKKVRNKYRVRWRPGRPLRNTASFHYVNIHSQPLIVFQNMTPSLPTLCTAPLPHPLRAPDRITRMQSSTCSLPASPGTRRGETRCWFPSESWWLWLLEILPAR